MRVIENYENIQASSGEFARPGNGGYILEIVNVTDVPYNEQTGKGDYLRIERGNLPVPKQIRGQSLPAKIY